MQKLPKELIWEGVPDQKKVRNGVPGRVRDQKGVPETGFPSTTCLDTMCLCFLDASHGGLF